MYMLQNNVSKIPYFYQGWESYLGFLGFLPYFYQGWESYLGFLGFLGALGPNHIENSLANYFQ